MPLAADDLPAIRTAFREAANMTQAELRRWLGKDESRQVGWVRAGETESVGYRSGCRILEIRGKRQAELDDDDYAHMRRVIGYVRRHLAQGGPAEGVETSRWRYSLMNWGHDPL